MDSDVIVVGGGLAGLTSAVGLADAGMRVTVLERDTRLGGRARSWTDATTGDPVHIGPHIFLNHYPNMFRLLDLLGTRDKIVWQHDGSFMTMVDGTREIPVRGSELLPAPYHFVPSLLADPDVSLADLASNWPVVEVALALDEAMVLRLDRLNARDFLQQMGVSARFIDRFWAFTAMAIMNVPLEHCSAGALMRFYRHLVSNVDLQIGFPDGGLGDLYAPQARARLERRGSRVLLRTAVDEFLVEDGRVVGVQLRDGSTLRARHVIAALPPPALAEITPAAWQTRAPFAHLARFEPVPYISLFLWFDRKLTRRQFWARAFAPDDLNCDFYDLSNIHREWGDRPSLITSNVIYSHRTAGMSDDDLVAATVRELSEYLPRAARAKLTHAVVHRIPMAIHAPQPGTEALRPPVRTEIPGLFLAGDWIQTRFPSSMESACAAGWMAAEAVLAESGRARALVQSTPGADTVPRFLARWGKRVRRARAAQWIEGG